jgi:hypothetical protein
MDAPWMGLSYCIVPQSAQLPAISASWQWQVKEIVARKCVVLKSIEK